MSVTDPPIREGAAFTDARTCREWLGALPMTNIPNAQYQVLSAMRALSANEGFDALERLKCLELVRDKVAYLQGEQRSRYFGKTLPLSANDTDAWRTGRDLMEELETGYRRCLAAASGAALAPGVTNSTPIMRPKPRTSPMAGYLAFNSVSFSFR